MSETSSVRVPLATGSHPSDQAPTGLGAPRFDPSRGRPIKCATCDGAGFRVVWSFGVKEPDECRACGGSGQNWRYPRGAIAKYYSGPLIGRDSDGSGEAGETGTGSMRSTTARAGGIAQTTSQPPQVQP